MEARSQLRHRPTFPSGVQLLYCLHSDEIRQTGLPGQKTRNFLDGQTLRFLDEALPDSVENRAM